MSSNRPIIIKRIKKGGGGHHGGAWKVAYADFVTAMMAFFLLMWLINTSSPEQKRGIADYFAPASVSRSNQGSDGLLGGTSFQEDGARASGANRPQMETQQSERRKRTRLGGDDSENGKKASDVSEDAIQQAQARRDQFNFDAAEQSLRQALQDMPELAELSKHIVVDQTSEGLRIQLVDQEGRAMFDGTSAVPLERTVRLMEAVAKAVESLPNRLIISGHTDTIAGPDPGYTNWELSSDRANAARRLLMDNGVDPDRIFQVSGKSSSEPLYPDDPDLPANRRISITLMREAPVIPADLSLSADD